MGNPTPGIQWYNFRPPGVTPNREWAPVRRFLSNFFDLLFYFILLLCGEERFLSLTVYGHIKTAEQRTVIQQYGDWYTGR